MKLAVIILSILLCFSSSQAQTTPHEIFGDYLFEIQSDHSYVNPAIPKESDLQISEVQNIFNQSQGYEDFIFNLKKRSPDLFKEPALVHSSGSLQFSSFERPRAILHRPGLMMAFSEPVVSPDRRVEIISYDPLKAQFSASEIIFANGKKEFNSQPQSCRTCHGEALRPIWLPYDLWPQSYGSLAGLLSSDSEKNQFANFLAKSSQVGIYKYLESLKDYKDNKVIGNDRMSLLVSGMNLHSFYFQLAKKKELNPFRFALLGAFKGCSGKLGTNKIVPIEKFIPAALKPGFSISSENLLQSSAKIRSQKTAYLTELYQRIFSTVPKFIEIESRLDNESFLIGDMRFILENMGFPLRSFQTSNGTYQYGMSLPTNIRLDVPTQSVEFFPELFRELSPEIVDLTGLKRFNPDCEDLQRRSLESLKNVSVSEIPKFENQKQVSIFGRCVSCHVSEKVGPFIPFDRSQEFSAWLNTGDNQKKIFHQIDSGRMPMGDQLSQADKDILKNVLLTLGSER